MIIEVSNCLLKSATRSAQMRNEVMTHTPAFGVKLPRNALVWDLI